MRTEQMVKTEQMAKMCPCLDVGADVGADGNDGGKRCHPHLQLGQRHRVVRRPQTCEDHRGDDVCLESDGDDGDDGADGYDGADGADGEDGADREDGAVQEDGDDGVDGADGEDGDLVRGGDVCLHQR